MGKGLAKNYKDELKPTLYSCRDLSSVSWSNHNYSRNTCIVEWTDSIKPTTNTKTMRHAQPWCCHEWKDCEALVVSWFGRLIFSKENKAPTPMERRSKYQFIDVYGARDIGDWWRLCHDVEDFASKGEVQYLSFLLGSFCHCIHASVELVSAGSCLQSSTIAYEQKQSKDDLDIPHTPTSLHPFLGPFKHTQLFQLFPRFSKLFNSFWGSLHLLSTCNPWISFLTWLRVAMEARSWYEYCGCLSSGSVDGK